MSVFFKKTINIIISLSLIIETTVMAYDSSQIVDEKREASQISDLLKSSTPSDIPYLKYKEFFQHEVEQPLSHYDLSAYQNQDLFLYIGYGIYDKEQKNCKFIELPTLDKTIFSGEFDTSTIFSSNQHSYVRSRNPMTYSQCKLLAEKYGGHVYSPGSMTEDNFFMEKYSNSENWIGIKRDDCQSEYVSDDGRDQEYFNWDRIYLSEFSCQDNETNVYSTRQRTWKKISPEAAKMCVIEIDSPDIYKPIKLCAPWWRVEREYGQNPDFSGLKGVKIAASSTELPDKMSICMKYNQKSIEERINDSSRVELQCTSYYDATRSQSCVSNPEQDICFVDNCAYAKNSGNCELIDEIENPRGYSKIEVAYKDANGTIQKKKIKTRLGDKTSIFSCLKFPPKSEDCLETAVVVIYPKECPGSKCDEQRLCLDSATTDEETKACIENFYCEKISGNQRILVTAYNSADFNGIAPNITDDGEVQFLYGQCHNEDKDYLKFEFDQVVTTKKECLKYEEDIVEKPIHQECEVERPYRDLSVNAALGEPDIYENNNSCIRINSVSDARPDVELSFSMVLPGFEETIVKESKSDGTENILKNSKNTQTLINPKTGVAENDKTIFEQVVRAPGFIEKKESEPITATDRSTSCVLGDDYLEKITILNPRSYSFPDFKKIIYNPSEPDAGKKYYISLSINTEQGCLDAKEKLEKKESLAEDLVPEEEEMPTSYPTIEVNTAAPDFENGVCKIYLTPSPNDKLVKQVSYFNTGDIDKAGNPAVNYELDILDNTSEETCSKYASCLDGVKEYDAGVCRIMVGPDFIPDKEDDRDDSDARPVSEQKNITTCKMGPLTDSFTARTNGLKSVISLQNVTFGGDEDFGYYSSEDYHPFESNKIQTANDSRLVSPPEEVYTFVDKNTYIRGKFKEISTNTKKPPGFLTSVLATSGAGGGAALAVEYGVLSAGTGWALVGAAFVASILFGHRKYYSELRHFWTVYEDIPKERFVSNKYDHRKIEDLGEVVRVTYMTNGREPTGDVTMTIAADGTKTYEGDFNFYTDEQGNYINSTGNLRAGTQYKRIKSDLVFFKKQALACLGWSISTLDNTPDFIYNEVENPNIDRIIKAKKCKWYKPSCTNRKSKSVVQNPVSIPKAKNVVYIGATNTMTIILPYKGDYELKALDKYGETLAEAEIPESAFIPATLEKHSYARVIFGNNMHTKVENPCVDSPVAEWGGGVSGAYFETGNADNHTQCSKSDDKYVKDHSATTITIKEKRTADEISIKLEKPMPWANRIFLVTLDNEETRRYRCYNDFPACGEEDFITQEVAK